MNSIRISRGFFNGRMGLIEGTEVKIGQDRYLVVDKVGSPRVYSEGGDAFTFVSESREQRKVMEAYAQIKNGFRRA